MYAKIHFLGSFLRRLPNGSLVYKRYLVETPLGTKAYDSLGDALKAAKAVLPPRPAERNRPGTLRAAATPSSEPSP